jgi:amino-acid N-acetyltransferase
VNAVLVSDHPASKRPRGRRVQGPRPASQTIVRSATAAEAPVLLALTEAYREEGRLLPRSLGELSVHAPRFVVAVRQGGIVGCAELAPLSGRVAEVRSLVVARGARALGIGRALVTELKRRARAAGFEQLCAFAHEAGHFIRLGFSIVPHPWVPEKIARDCTSCALFRRCGQHALVLPLRDARQPSPATFVPLASLGG